jgi:hypothetical protein
MSRKWYYLHLDLNLNKATSWDFIPGKSWEQFIRNPKGLETVASFINKLLDKALVPPELTKARLMCLNKDASKAGNIDSIRPITIVSVLIKIIKHPIKEYLKEVKLNKAQTGFRGMLSTELNLIRIRHKTKELLYRDYDRKRKLPKLYILFVDFQMAFDKVTYQILLTKMMQKGIDTKIINTVIWLYNNSFVSPDLEETINVNSGVGQGKLCSPFEFDIFIADLLDELEKICSCCLAFADDTGFINYTYEELMKTIDALTKWSERNVIKINKKKSGILIVNDD